MPAFRDVRIKSAFAVAETHGPKAIDAAMV